ncbi:MAG: SMC-Scp complex subunit ScpB [Candidatus Omnitrophica bacterium]|nr:SMC-Scp complex subunit ScpB [Candidatus Omnitrophota bacterium]
MINTKRLEKQKQAEAERKLKELREELEDELSRQLGEIPAKTQPKVVSEELDTSGDVDNETAKRVIEALLFASGKPVSIPEMRKVLKGSRAEEIHKIVLELAAEYERDQRSFRIQHIAGGWEVSTESKYAPWILKLEQQKRVKQATISALETLAIIAYKQPLSRVEIEDLRGVDCSAVLTTLLERGLVKIAGRKEIPGRPFLYGTTDKFLEHFGLSAIDQLPNIENIKQLVEGFISKETLLKPDRPVEVPNETVTVNEEETPAGESPAAETTS